MRRASQIPGCDRIPADGQSAGAEGCLTTSVQGGCAQLCCAVVKQHATGGSASRHGGGESHARAKSRCGDAAAKNGRGGNGASFDYGLGERDGTGGITQVAHILGGEDMDPCAEIAGGE